LLYVYNVHRQTDRQIFITLTGWLSHNHACITAILTTGCKCNALRANDTAMILIIGFLENLKNHRSPNFRFLVFLKIIVHFELHILSTRNNTDVVLLLTLGHQKLV